MPMIYKSGEHARDVDAWFLDSRVATYRNGNDSTDGYASQHSKDSLLVVF